MRKPFMCKWVGKFNSTLLILVILVSSRVQANDQETAWPQFEQALLKKRQEESTRGLSYVLSGSIAMVGGFVGQGVSQDPLEKGVYTLFQTIGIASIGYGAYLWKMGDDESLLYEAVGGTSLSAQEKGEIVTSYRAARERRNRKERMIKAITHGMIAALNLYTASQQPAGAVQSGLYFIGSISLLASISFTF